MYCAMAAVYTHVCTYSAGACSVYIVVWGLGLCTYGGHTTVQYIVQCYIHTVYVSTLCNSTCACVIVVYVMQQHRHCVIVGRYFFKKVHSTLYVRIQYSYGFLLYMV